MKKTNLKQIQLTAIALIVIGLSSYKLIPFILNLVSYEYLEYWFSDYIFKHIIAFIPITIGILFLIQEYFINKKRITNFITKQY